VSIASIGDTIAIARTYMEDGLTERGVLHLVDRHGASSAAAIAVDAHAELATMGAVFVVAGGDVQLVNPEGRIVGASIELDPGIRRVRAIGVEASAIHLLVESTTEQRLAIVEGSSVRYTALPASTPGAHVARFEGAHLHLSGWNRADAFEAAIVDVSAEPPSLVRSFRLEGEIAEVVGVAVEDGSPVVFANLYAEDSERDPVLFRAGDDGVFSSEIFENVLQRYAVGGDLIATPHGLFGALASSIRPLEVTREGDEARAVSSGTFAHDPTLAFSDSLGVIAAWLDSEATESAHDTIRLRCGLDR
jgi:hypothetical protein